MAHSGPNRSWLPCYPKIRICEPRAIITMAAWYYSCCDYLTTRLAARLEWASASLRRAARLLPQATRLLEVGSRLVAAIGGRRHSGNQHPSDPCSPSPDSSWGLSRRAARPWPCGPLVHQSTVEHRVLDSAAADVASRGTSLTYLATTLAALYALYLGNWDGARLLRVLVPPPSSSPCSLCW
jgi:hypothetical protein